MLKEEIRQKLFSQALKKGSNLEESLEILSEALVDYEVTRKWIFIYLYLFTKNYYSIDEKSIYIINECMSYLESHFEEELLQNDKKYGNEDTYIEGMYESIKKDVDELIHPKIEIDSSRLYSDICNHKCSNNINLYPIEIDRTTHLRCDICPPWRSIHEEQQEPHSFIVIKELIDTINKMGVKIPSQLQKELDVVKELIEFSIEDK